MESGTSSQTSREIAQAVLLDVEQRSRLVAYAYSRFGIDSDDAQDMLQETAMELLRQRSLVRNPLGYTFKVFHIRCCRFLQTRQAHRQVFAGAQDPAETACGATVETAHKRLELREVLETISSSCRRVILAYYVEGRSLRETAQAVPLPYSGVWNTINQCLRRLRACFAS